MGEERRDGYGYPIREGTQKVVEGDRLHFALVALMWLGMVILFFASTAALDGPWWARAGIILLAGVPLGKLTYGMYAAARARWERRR